MCIHRHTVMRIAFEPFKLIKITIVNYDFSTCDTFKNITNVLNRIYVAIIRDL